MRPHNYSLWRTVLQQTAKQHNYEFHLLQRNQKTLKSKAFTWYQNTLHSQSFRECQSARIVAASNLIKDSIMLREGFLLETALIEDSKLTTNPGWTVSWSTTCLRLIKSTWFESVVWYEQIGHSSARHRVCAGGNRSAWWPSSSSLIKIANRSIRAVLKHSITTNSLKKAIEFRRIPSRTNFATNCNHEQAISLCFHRIKDDRFPDRYKNFFEQAIRQSNWGSLVIEND